MFCCIACASVFGGVRTLVRHVALPAVCVSSRKFGMQTHCEGQGLVRREIRRVRSGARVSASHTRRDQNSPATRLTAFLFHRSSCLTVCERVYYQKLLPVMAIASRLGLFSTGSPFPAYGSCSSTKQYPLILLLIRGLSVSRQSEINTHAPGHNFVLPLTQTKFMRYKVYESSSRPLFRFPERECQDKDKRLTCFDSKLRSKRLAGGVTSGNETSYLITPA